jgi:hypothetical protein
MNEHQLLLWRSMIDKVQAYERTELGLSVLVQGLEGLLDAGEFRDSRLRAEWYDRWSPLEMRSAVQGDAADRVAANMEVRAFGDFLVAVLARRAPGDDF